MFPTLIVFTAITAWILGPRWLRMWHEQKLKALDMGGRQDGVRIQVLEGVRKELEDRVRNLESIVCGVDLELNAKLNRLASQQLAMLPAHASSAPPALRAQGTSGADLSHAATAVAMQLGAGDRVGNRYVIERSLGSGGMGEVYLARDEKLGEPVALKLLRDAFNSDASLLDRFRREVTLARRISHPNVVRLHDLGQEGSLLFLSMEYVAGESLREVLRRQGALNAALVRSLLVDVCAGLGAAHAAGVTHRDLKPENILVHGASHAKIIDFGIAKLADLEGMTATRMILGTPQYMSPEQIRGLPVDARSDLYALTVVAFEALTGKVPFEGGSAISIGYAHCNEPAPTLHARRPEVDPRWESFVARGLEKDPAQRFQGADEMSRALPP
jgi:serine/threonine-protein kinase